MWISDTAFFIFVAFALLLIAFLLWLIVFQVIDENFLSYKNGKATLISTRFSPASSTVIMETVLVGKSVLLIPHTIHSPDAYYAKLAMNGLEGETAIPQDMFVKLKSGVTVVDVEYSKKRFSNELSFNSVVF